MDASYAWHPGARGINPMWARPVPIFPDELLSSWLVRAALAQGCDPLVLTGCIWPKWRAWTQDVDRAVTTERLAALARLSGISVDTFEAVTLQVAINRTCGKTPSRMGTWPWILSLGARNTKRRGGLQYCPECLLADHEPYYRIQWRFAWHTGCERHGRSLLDRCWNCGAPLEPHRLRSEDKQIATCATCRADLRATIGNPWSAAAQAFQITADKVITERTGVALGQSLLVSEWFDLATYITSLVRQASRFGSGTLKGVIESITSSPLPEVLPESVGIEHICTTERQGLLGLLGRVLETDAEKFKASCVAYGLTRQGLCRVRRALPLIVLELSQALKDSPRGTRQISSCPKSIGPRPRHVVKCMMARLERRARRLSR